MKLQSKKIVGSLVGVVIIVLVIFGEFSLLPLEFASLSYWLGFVVWFSIGALLIMSTKKGVTRVGGVTVMVLGFALVVLSRSYTSVGDALAAVPGIFVGMLARFLVIAFFDSKTAYCNTCKAETLMDKRNGKWFCVQGNHFVVDTNREAGLETKIQQVAEQ